MPDSPTQLTRFQLASTEQRAASRRKILGLTVENAGIVPTAERKIRPSCTLPLEFCSEKRIFAPGTVLIKDFPTRSTMNTVERCGLDRRLSEGQQKAFHHPPPKPDSLWNLALFWAQKSLWTKCAT
jgi:hypothetical protein